MTKKERYARCLEYFRTAMPEVKTELTYTDPFQLLVAVILSAQCTDKRVNMITPALFADYPTAEAMAVSQAETIYEYVKSVSYPNAKARHLVAMAEMLMRDYGGEVPSDRDALQRLPGVGRKTANVVVSVAFGQEAIAVDTHVFRVAHRLGLVPKRCTTPLAVEQELMKHIPKEYLHDAHHWLLLHGRYTCQARRPKCEACGLKDICPNAKCKMQNAE